MKKEIHNFQMQWDICPYLHAMSDMGREAGSDRFNRAYTYTAECYAIRDKGDCARKGRQRGKCLHAVFL